MTKMNTSFNPMPLSIDPIQFKKLYIQVISDKSSNPEAFIRYIEDFIKEVSDSIQDKNENFYFYYFLKKNILSFTNEKSIDLWIESGTVKEDLLYVLFMRLKKIKTIPTQAKPVMCQFYFVTDYRLAVSNFIKKNYLTKPLPVIEQMSHDNPKAEIRIKPHYWYNYLVSMLSLGYTITEISKLTGYSRTTIYKELNKYVFNKKTSN